MVGPSGIVFSASHGMARSCGSGDVMASGYGPWGPWTNVSCCLFCCAGRVKIFYMFSEANGPNMPNDTQ